MSFSGQIKEELAQVISSPRHCQLAELAALVQFCGHIEEDGSLLVQSENPLVVRKCFTLLKKTFKIEAVAKSQMQTQNYRLFVTGEDAFRVLEALKICDTAGHLMMRHLTEWIFSKKRRQVRIVQSPAVHLRKYIGQHLIAGKNISMR